MLRPVRRAAGIAALGLLLCSGESAGQLFSVMADKNGLKPAYADAAPVCNCADLIKVTIPNTVIESAEIIARDSSCRVTAVVTHPPFNDRVKVTTALPLKNWNGRYYGNGGGGFAAGVFISLGGPLSFGFATGITDGGHEGGSGAFALDTQQHRLKWQEIRDFTHLGIHDMTVVGKALVQAFYGKPARWSYFVGSSNGGRQGLVEAQCYPDDYDGIIAGCPAIYWDRNAVAGQWPQAVMNDARNYVSREKLQAVTRKVVEECDDDDGVVDGVINDPFSCTWDPASFVGTPVGNSVFTAADADVVRKIWEGPRRYDGTFLWYGLTRGSDMTIMAATKGDPLKGAAWQIPLEWIRYFLLLDPDWDMASLTLAEFELLFNQSSDQYATLFRSDNSDLSGFRDSGGKLIIMHGLADQMVFPQGTIGYYDQVLERMGGVKATSKFARLFLIPGVNHAFFGAGASPVDQFDALVRWVEEGKAPEYLKGVSKDNTSKSGKTSTLMPYKSGKRGLN